MELSDALIITGLGMAVVFSGLLLTAALIVGFGFLQRLLDSPATNGRSARQTPDPVAAAPTGTLPDAPMDAEILTVIVTVLEVERRLHRLGGATAGSPK